MTSAQKILVIDYGVGNHQSVVNALQFLGYDVELAGDEAAIRRAHAYVLPGVGAIGEGMRNIERLKIVRPLEEEVLGRKKPILGICLGMQMLAKSSEEGGFHRCLGWIDGEVIKMNVGEQWRVPHVGWNTVDFKDDHPILDRVPQGANFYFDHGYHFVCEDQYVMATCQYGSRIVAAVRKDNIFGVQFHPEKSQNNGLKLFRSFLNYAQAFQKAVV